jgi:hypothetical protein
MWADKDNKLLGKKIIEIEIADEKDFLKFITDSEPVFMQVEADCCSTSWIEHISLPELPAVCLKIEDVEMPKPSKEELYKHAQLNYSSGFDPEGTEEEKDLISGSCLKCYGLKIITDKGYLDIEYRNSSNGFYGGRMQFLERDPIVRMPEYDGEPREKIVWLPIKEDC